MPHQSKVLDILCAKAQEPPDILKALSILSDTTIRRSKVDPENLKPYWKSEKRSHFSRGPTSHYLQVFPRLY